MPSVSFPKIEAAYRDRFPESAKLYETARRLFPNGVTHDGRFLLPFPVYVNRAEGSRKWTAEGRELVDYWVGHGSLLLGHSHPAVVEAVQRQAALCTHPGACHELEIRWAEAVQRLFPSAERMRFTNSGTEATLMAVRVARIASGRKKVLKFAGHFHGWHDSLIPAADGPYQSDSNAAPDAGRDYPTPGVTEGTLSDLVVIPPNDLAAVARAIDKHQPACLILEATGGHWGTVPMRGEFLRGLRQLTRDKNVILIFDEVITGFRVHPGGSQGHYEITPDLTSLAKILAGGLPGGCLAGRADLMQAIEFDNPFGRKMKHPGTYNANPLSAAAGVAALAVVATGEPCRQANAVAAQLRHELNQLFARKSANWVAYGEFSGIKFLPEYDGPRPDGDDFIPYGGSLEKLDRKFDPSLSHAFRCAMLLGGVDVFGLGAMTSSAHSARDVDQTVAAMDRAIDLLRADKLLR
ncbi:MAG: aminotransferase class III-fold pyridoxal phosphate-dependent enzyme [Planctomycetales bacterium]|nr:aminotransferase class III-fold pyridoxal phosphate-dependent enzyme [Planctomycetales bacterium]